MKSCLFTIGILLCALAAAGQDNASPAAIVKVYPLSALKDEYRIGLERELKPGESIEYGLGYLYRTIERTDCNECWGVPMYTPYTGKGGAVRVNFNTYRDPEKSLEGVYTSIGLKYSFIRLDKTNRFYSGPAIPDGYAISNQHSLSAQLLAGRKYYLQNWVADFYAGFNVGTDYNSYRPLRQEYKPKDPALRPGIGVNLGVSFGYRYSRK